MIEGNATENVMITIILSSSLSPTGTLLNNDYTAYKKRDKPHVCESVTRDMIQSQIYLVKVLMFQYM